MKSQQLIIITILVIINLASCLDQAQIAAIDEVIQNQFLPDNHIPGLGLSIIDGSSSLAKGYGFRDLEQGLVTTANTYFNIGSISKSFTALVIVRVLSNAFPDLDEAVLDVPIRDLIPSYNFTLIDRFRSENTNFRDLLSHRVCTLPESWGLYTAPYKTKAEFIYRQRYGESLCSTRTEFVYNNGLIQLAGEIAAAIAGKTFEELLIELFNDIGMPGSSFISESDDLEGMTMLARPYYRFNGTTQRFNMELLKTVSIAPGSGGILTTPNEFVNYIRFHLNNGRVGSVQVIPENIMKWLQKLSNHLPFIQFKTEPNEVLNSDIGYGLGVFIGTYDGYLKISHGGYLPPFASHWTNVPELDLGVFTTVNGPGGAARQELLHAAILNILTNSTRAINLQTQESSSIPSYEKSFKPINRPSPGSKPSSSKNGNVKQEELVGIYGHPMSGEFNITIVNDTTLFMNYGRFGQAWLNQKGSNSTIYDVIWDSDLVQLFLADLPAVPPALIDFSEDLIAYIEVDDGSGARVGFTKDGILDSLPVQPWDPGSCFSK